MVASEVKSLANETGKATEDIKRQVLEITEKSLSAARSLEAVKVVIDDNKGVSHETARSVDEQKDAIKEIACNIEQASVGTEEITKNITHISEGAQGVSEAATGILGAARDLSMQGAALNDAVNLFIQNLKAGSQKG